MRKFLFALVVVVGLVCIGLAFRRPPTHDQSLKSYFRSGSNVQAGAPVCVDGVKLGVVTRVRVRPELGERPVEVLMAISSPYKLAIPDDSTVGTSTEGVLGRTFADIDTRNAHGPAVRQAGVLKSSDIAPVDGAKALKSLMDALIQTPSPSVPQEQQHDVPGRPADSHAK
jgi:ABC-type transporter Mla subunit MlaD